MPRGASPYRYSARCTSTVTPEIVEVKRALYFWVSDRLGDDCVRAAGHARPAVEALVAFIDARREVFGVESICRTPAGHGLKISTSTYYAARKRTPSARAVRDAELKTRIRRVHADKSGVDEVRKVWRHLRREGIAVTFLRPRGGAATGCGQVPDGPGTAPY